MNSLELFAGAGGLALGTARAGFRHRLVLEWDKDACDTLRKNNLLNLEHARDWKIVETDVRGFDFGSIASKIHFICGGPPCQPFSIGGKHNGHADERNMFPQAIRAVREIQPRAFLFENVKGLLRRSFANYYSYILHQLRYPTVTSRGDEEWTDHLARLEQIHTSGEHPDVHYNVVYQLMNAVDYGVPQHRWRVFVVGIRSDLGFKFSFPQRTHEQEALLYSMWISGEYWDRHKIPKSKRPARSRSIDKRVQHLQLCSPDLFLRPWRTVRDAIADLPRVKIGAESKKVWNHFLNPGARSYAGHNGSPLDEPAKTLKAGDHGVPGGENTLRLIDGTVRYFSVRECARLQTFPDNWILGGSWTEAMRQVGNAVPVGLAEVVARDLYSTLRSGHRQMTN